MRRLLGTLVTLLLLGTLVAATPTAHASRMPSKRTWQAQNAKIMRGSVTWLRERVESRHPTEKLAINLDIDNTSLASYYAPGKPVRPTLRLARVADSLGVKVLFNTARPEKGKRKAVRELRRAGFPVYGICARAKGLSVVEGKQDCRARFRKRGYTLVVNVGNRPTDFEGGGFEKRYKLRSYGGRLS
ncbi:HAD family acid phosphatase [Nocardioides aequoreus]|uniref:HAD family acid phosphatase n=1 Tax=Nocardioides aequoreus TaxID=397278 RepID=UPI00068E2773|nr:HAD family acid phosphatase [Nocardioides aequoreus]